VLSVLSGSEQGTVGAWAAVQYLGAFSQDASFQFLIDYTNATFSADSLAIGVHTPETAVPGPASGLLLVTALLSIGSRFRRR
jgi:ATP-dependent Lon protease